MPQSASKPLPETMPPPTVHVVSGEANTNHLWQAHTALFSVGVIYAIFWVVCRVLLQSVPAIEFITHRLLWSGTLCALLQIFWVKTKFNPISDLWKLMGISLLGVLLAQAILAFGIERTTVLHASLIMALTPIMTLGLSIVLKREPFQWQKLIGILISFFGVSMLLWARDPKHPMPPDFMFGDIIIFFCALGFSFYLLGTQPLIKKYNPATVMTWGYMTGALVVLLLLPFYPMVGVDPMHVLDLPMRANIAQLGTIAYIVVFASMLTYLLNNFALARIHASTVAIYIFAQPVIASVIAWFAIGEAITLPMLLAMGITFAGILTAIRSKQAS